MFFKFYLGKDLKKVFLTNGFPYKNVTQHLPYMMTVYPKCFFIFFGATFTVVRSKTRIGLKYLGFPANFSLEIAHNSRFVCLRRHGK